MQSCLQRLQSLQQQFLHIDSPGELADAEQEGGLILAQLLHYQHVDPDSLLLNSRDILLDYAAGALATRDARGIPLGKGLAEHYQQTLWTFIAMGCSDQQRILFHDAGPAPTWTFSITAGEQKYQQQLDTGVRLKTTDRAKDFRQQGKRYALFTAELLARIQTAPLDAEQDTTGKPKPIRGLSVDKLEPIVAGILATEGRKRNLTAEDVYRLATDAGHKTSPANIKKTHSWEVYATGIGKARQSNRPKQAISDTLDVLVDESRQIRRTGRKTKPIEPGE
jgi:hypothetical protein